MANITDSIADMLTRIRNANQMKYAETSMPSTKQLVEIAKILKAEGFINDFETKLEEGKVQEILTINLKYSDKKERVITGLKRISKPGLRVYAKAEEVPRVFNGLGIAIISTSQGMMTDKEARAKKVGGEVLAYVW